MARISAIVPAYNASGFIAGCIESVIAQSFADWELIIIDDGSTDGTGALCDGYAERDARIRVIHQPNSGVSSARNKGLDKAEGSVIAFLDADDSLVPEAYETMAALLDDHGVNTAACANYLSYPDGKAPVYEAGPVPPGLCPDPQAAIAIPLLCDRLSPAPLNGYVWRYLFDREIINNNKIRFTGKYLEDELFLIEYFCCGASLAATDKALYNYLQNSASVTKKYLPSFTETFLTSLLIKNRLVTRYKIPVTPQWLENTCWAGLLIAVSNEFAPGNTAPMGEKIKHIRRMSKIPEFAKAVANYEPKEIRGNKALVASLLRGRAYAPLALMYEGKRRLGG